MIEKKRERGMMREWERQRERWRGEEGKDHRGNAFES